MPLEPNQSKPSLIVQNNSPTFAIIRPRHSAPTSLGTLISQPKPITALSNPPEPLPMNPPPEHWTIPSTKTQPSSVITQPPTFKPSTSQVSNVQAAPHPFTFRILTCAPFSGQLQTFGGTEYRYRPEKF